MCAWQLFACSAWRLAQDVTLLQFVSAADLKYPKGQDGATTKAFLRKTLSECETRAAHAAAAAPATVKEPSGITEGKALCALLFIMAFLLVQKPC